MIVLFGLHKISNVSAGDVEPSCSLNHKKVWFVQRKYRKKLKKILHTSQIVKKLNY